MTYTVIKEDKFPIKIWAEDLGESEINQIKNLAKLPFIHKHVAIMPDAHLGKGCTIGSVVPTVKAIIPAAVGVDLGCGMMAVQTNLTANDMPESLTDIRRSIERTIPLGAGGKYKNDENRIYKRKGINNLFILNSDVDRFIRTSQPNSNWNIEFNNWVEQLGTLGSGNHFIELCLDENDNVWVMLHSGSRGIGNKIGSKFIELAKEDMRTYHINVPDVDLSYLSEGTKNFNEYVEAVNWAQEYAAINRRLMMNLVFGELQYYFPHVAIVDMDINCHHNYVEKENHYGKNVYVTRKGAIRARKGDLGIIPGSMGAKSYIVRGKGNLESFHSCSHGAGRKMSRNEAKGKFSISDLREQVKGVNIDVRESVIDEIPSAYKDIDRVMELQNDLVEKVHTLKQILCVKGN